MSNVTESDDKPDIDPDGFQAKTIGYIHSIETAGTVDGPGVRYVVFLTGCPLSCWYCHNPDCMKMKNGFLRSAGDILDDIQDYRWFIERAKGGVTISGGEPLAQPQFVKTLFRGVKALGMHTALDTSGFLNKAADEELLSYVDLVLLDIKSGLPDLYKKVTGVALQPTLDFAQKLDDIGKPVWVRFVLVPDLTDGEDNIEEVAKICARHKNIERIDILPFHQMGEYKWHELGMEYKLQNTRQADETDVERARAIFARHGIKAV
ncbi:MAG: pyruvate formate lyase-activating protein [Alphaproteobacteria bacterium]|nr:pyruvate formate lyase-activating protein [Alphaproteobacteria bacterium]